MYNKSQTPKRDLWAEVTARVEEALAAGIVPWARPWQAGDDAHRNPASGTQYRGVNPMLLEMTALSAGYTDRRWVTFKGAQSLGGKVRKGERSTTVVFFKRMMVEDENGSIVRDGKRFKVLPLLKHFCVFNVAQCDGLNLPAEEERAPFVSDERCERVASEYLQREALTFANGGDVAYYAPSHDHLGMPYPEAFVSTAAYYSTLFHEMGHSTGHASRLNRPDLTGGHRFGSKGYAREELTAEMTAAMLCGYCDILPAQIDQTAAYIANWRQVIADDPRCVVVAAQRAQRAADHILNVSYTPDESADVQTATVKA